MGKMKNGILDAFSGTIGRVVGTFWRGVAVKRSKAHARKNTNTPKQQEQKAKFKVAADFTQSIHDLLILGFRDQAVQMTVANYGLSLILTESVYSYLVSIPLEVDTSLVSDLIFPFGGAGLFCPSQELQKTNTRNEAYTCMYFIISINYPGISINLAFLLRS
jgi:hypothetical protein